MSNIPAVSEFKNLHEVMDGALPRESNLTMEHISFRADPYDIERFRSMCRAMGKSASDVFRAWMVTAVNEFNSVDA